MQLSKQARVERGRPSRWQKLGALCLVAARENTPKEGSHVLERPRSEKLGCRGHLSAGAAAGQGLRSPPAMGAQYPRVGTAGAAGAGAAFPASRAALDARARSPEPPSPALATPPPPHLPFSAPPGCKLSAPPAPDLPRPLLWPRLFPRWDPLNTPQGAVTTPHESHLCPPRASSPKW